MWLHRKKYKSLFGRRKARLVVLRLQSSLYTIQIFSVTRIGALCDIGIGFDKTFSSDTEYLRIGFSTILWNILFGENPDRIVNSYWKDIVYIKKHFRSENLNTFISLLHRTFSLKKTFLSIDLHEDSKVSKIMVKSPDLTICLSVTKKQLENATCRSDLYNFILGLVSGYLILEKISRAFMKTVSESITF